MGPNPTDRGKKGSKESVLVDGEGGPLGVVLAPANVNDHLLLRETIEALVIESVIGSKFTGRVAKTTTFGPHDAIIPEVEGTARITGRHEFLIDPGDELRGGFLLR